MRDILLVGIVAVSCLIALRRPVYGILFFVFLGVFNPLGMVWGFAKSLPLSQMTAISTLVGYVGWNESKSFPKQREIVLVLLLWTIFGLTTIFGMRPAPAFAAFILISKIFLMLAFVLLMINTRDRLNSFVKVISLSLGFYAVKGTLFVLITGGTQLVYGPDGNFLTANNSIGLALAMNVPLLAYVLRVEKRFWLRWVVKGMIVCSFPSVVFTYSRGAWLGLAMATALLILKSRRKFIIGTVGGILGVVLMSAVPLITPERLSARYDSLVHYEDDSSAQSRLWNWEFCKRVGMGNPVIGGGFDYYSIDLYATYYPEFLARFPGKAWSCHSIWLTMFSEHGIIGFAVWFTLIVCSITSLRRIRSLVRNRPELAWAGDCAEMTQVAFVVFLVVGTFLDAAHFDLFYYLVAITIILKERLRIETETKSLQTVNGKLTVPAFANRRHANAT